MQSQLDTHGYAVVRSAVAEELVEEWLCTLRTVDGADHAHSDLLWTVRQNPGVLRVFSDAWGGLPAESLSVGYDGAAYRPPHHPGLVLDWHVDQDGSHPPGRVCVQGVLALTHVNASSGGTVLLPASHLHHESLVRTRSSTRGVKDEWEFVPVWSKHAVFDACPAPVQPILRPGDLLVWDSRLLHRVVPPLDEQTHRGVVYLSMVPTEWISDDVRRTRRAFYDEGVSTTHWSTRCVDRDDERQPPTVPYETAPARVRTLVDGDPHG